MSVICLDFDGVLHDPYNRDEGHRMGKPVPGALDACWLLHSAKGHELVVHTARVQLHADIKHVEDWLTYFRFPPMKVSLTKPLADIYVDDRAVPFGGWVPARISAPALGQLALDNARRRRASNSSTATAY